MTTSSDDEDLDARIKRAQAALDPVMKRSAASKGESLGWKVIAELLGAILMALILGSYLDSWFETRPWIMLGLLVLGLVVAIRNVIRLSTTSVSDD